MSELTMAPEEFVRVGECNRFCGRCCNLAYWQQHPLYETVRHVLEAPPFLGMKENGDCPNLAWEHGMARCAIYATRPEICRVFPLHPVSIETIPQCTFQFRAQEKGVAL